MGEGIKRMKGYKCKLPLDELNKLREQFWSKISDNKYFIILYLFYLITYYLLLIILLNY